ncbi:MAG: class I SAM-dependent methyltransferase [Candidatus Heimdallarchaeota archaeon]
MTNLERERQQLSELGLSLPLEAIQTLGQLHLSEIWAEIFWRRKSQHSTREDPELSHLFQANPRRILEIGAGYGRVTRKIVELKEERKQNSEIFGIELCSYFERFFQQYSNEFPSLKQVQMIFEDFFSSQALEKHSFDVILLPMNTFPSFPIDMLPQLFKRTLELLSPNGRFIFSTYKISKEIQPVEAKHSGEIRVTRGQGPLIGEFFELPHQIMAYGARLVTYTQYTKLTLDHQKELSYLFRTIRELIKQEVLESIINENGFQIALLDDSSHSRVYSLQPQID